MKTISQPHRPRRGTILAIVVLMLAVVNIVALNVLETGASEVEVGAMRVESARALFAGESALMGVARLRRDGLTLPITNATLILPHAQARFVQVPLSNATSGTVRVVGESGLGQRRLELEFQLQ